MNIEKVMDWLDATCTPESHAAYDEIEKLTKQRDEYADTVLAMNMNRRHLEKQRDMLIDLLDRCMNEDSMQDGISIECIDKCRAAITSVKGSK